MDMVRVCINDGCGRIFGCIANGKINRCSICDNHPRLCGANKEDFDLTGGICNYCWATRYVDKLRELNSAPDKEAGSLPKGKMRGSTSTGRD